MVWTTIRDLWRGYTDADARRVAEKLGGPNFPGAIIPMSLPERRAMLDNLINPCQETGSPQGYRSDNG